MAVKKAGKIRPPKGKHGGEVHGFYSLVELLKKDLDARLAIVKERNEREAAWVEYAGGQENLSPPVASLIKEIVAKELASAQGRKMSLVGMFDLTAKNFLALSNSLRLDMLALEGLLRGGAARGRTPDLGDYLKANYVEGGKADGTK